MGWLHTTPIPAVANGADQTFRPLDTKRWPHLRQTGPGYVSMLTIKPQTNKADNKKNKGQEDMGITTKKRAKELDLKAAPIECIDRRSVVLAGTGLGKTTLYKQIKEGSFPAPVVIGARAVGWRRSEWQAWVKSRCARR